MRFSLIWPIALFFSALPAHAAPTLAEHLNEVLFDELNTRARAVLVRLNDDGSFARSPVLYEWAANSYAKLSLGALAPHRAESVTQAIQIGQEIERLKSESLYRAAVEAGQADIVNEKQAKFNALLKPLRGMSKVASVLPWSGGPSGKLLQQIDATLELLHPTCALKVRPTFGGTYLDANACDAGANWIFAALEAQTPLLRTSSATWLSEMQKQFDQLWSGLASVPNEFDFLSYQRKAGQTSYQWASWMSFFLTAPYSTVGYLTEISSLYLGVLLRDDLPAGEVLTRFHKFRGLIDQFKFVYSTWGKNQKKIHYLYQGENIDTYIHHEYISFFLSCSLLQRGADLQSRALPETLGVIYESLDFYSHWMKEGVSWKDAWKNFQVDTERYRTGVGLAEKFCR